MAPALDATKYIYEGIWINWSRGSILGSTLTVSPQHASILSPAIAILVSIAGTQLWALSQYIIHQTRATPQQRSFVYHQSQSILRNSTSDVDAMSRLSRLVIAWRHQKHTRFLIFVAPLFLWALFHFVLVTCAGVFSSVLLAGDQNVLSRSPWCGNFNNTYMADVYYPTQPDDPSAVKLSNEYNSYANSRLAYVQQLVDVCGDGSQHCAGPRPKPLPFTTTFVPGACPVNSSICHPDAGGSMTFDTGFLSSHTHLGYNAPGKDRVSVRLTAQCSPLKPQGYISAWQNISTSRNSTARQLCDARYGTAEYSTRNATASLTKKELTCDESRLEAPYLLMPQEFLPGTDGSAVSSTFTPIDELYVSDADLSLVTLASQNVHTNPIADPWFSAQQVADPAESSCDLGNDTLYAREYPLTAVACTQQWQICSTDSLDETQPDKCTSPASFYQTLDQIDVLPPKLPLNPRQLAVAQRFMFSGQTSSIYYFVYALSQSSFVPLKARDAPHGKTGPTIPSDQWKTEMKYWMELVVATFQQANLDYSTGQFAASTAYVNVSTPKDISIEDAVLGQNHWICQNQMIHSSDYRNFNFFALLITVIVCVIIIALGLSIEDITGCIRERKLRSVKAGTDESNGTYSKQDIWLASSDLNMLRQLDEASNGTVWSLHRNGVPVTHVSHEVSVNDFMKSQYRVEEKIGVVVTPVKSKVSAFVNAKERGFKRAVTSSTSEVSPDGFGRFGARPVVLDTGDGCDALRFDSRIIQ